MPLVRFTTNIQRHVPCPDRQVVGSTVRAALDAVFADNEKARGYVLDDAGGLRRHMTVFIDGRIVADRLGLSDSVAPGTRIDVMQALSGG